MSLSKSEICNMAIAHLGIGKLIVDVDTDRSAESRACLRFYDVAARATMRDADWPFTTKFVDLNLVEEDPTDEWGYSYTVPPDCVKARRIPSGVRNAGADEKVAFRIAYGDSGQVIYTDQPDATLEYTAVADEEARWSADFSLAVSFRLASLIAPHVTGGDNFALSNRAMQMYLLEVGKAVSNAFNEERRELAPASELERSRL